MVTILFTSHQQKETFDITYAKVATTDGSYVGLAQNFKKRWNKHKTTLNDRNTDGQTTLSTYITNDPTPGKLSNVNMLAQLLHAKTCHFPNVKEKV